MSNALHQDYQLELIYNKLKEYKVLILSLFIFLIGGAIFQAIWSHHTHQLSTEGSNKFDSYMLTQVKHPTAEQSINPLIEELGESKMPLAYRLYAHLEKSKYFVAKAEYNKAISELLWITEQRKIDPAFKQIAANRVARILLEKNQSERAIKVLTHEIYDENFDTSRLTILGKAYAMNNQPKAARESFEEAFKLAKTDPMRDMITNLRHDLIVHTSQPSVSLS